jgi:beta-glucosidase
VVVLINGRALSVNWAAKNVPAIVEAWIPGEAGGHAVADVLFGDHNPSGRLPVTFPRHSGQLPMFYNHPPSKAYWTARKSGYVDMPSTPLFAFGHGLTYTNFSYSGLSIEPKTIPSTGSVTVSLSLENTGARSGEEVVQLYINDVVATVTRPVKELRGFSKVALAPGQKETVKFTVPASELWMLDRSMKRVVEPGEFAVMVGASAEDIKLKGSFEVK